MFRKCAAGNCLERIISACLQYSLMHLCKSSASEVSSSFVVRRPGLKGASTVLHLLHGLFILSLFMPESKPIVVISRACARQEIAVYALIVFL